MTALCILLRFAIFVTSLLFGFSAHFIARAIISFVHRITPFPHFPPPSTNASTCSSVLAKSALTITPSLSMT